MGKQISPKLFYNVNGLVLDIRVKDGERITLFHDKCNITNLKEMNRIFNVLNIKFGIDVMKALKKEDWWEGFG